MKKLVLIVISFIVLFSVKGQNKNIRDLYQEGIKAYEVKNYELFKEKMFIIDTMRPNYPAVVYNLAGSYALTGEVDKSIETLKKYILMDASQDFTKDTDFESIKDLDDLAEIQKLQELLSEEVPVEPIFNWPIQSSHPESITFSKEQNSYFVGGVRDGNIWKVVNGSSPQLWAESGINSWSVMGLEVSKDGKYLWACTSAMENYSGFSQNDKGYSSVLKFDIKTGECLDKYTLSGDHVFGDLISDNRGKVFVSDGTANMVYIVNEKKGQLEIFKDISKSIFNLQGITFNNDQTAIYMSDYIDGIYKLDIDSKNITKLKVKADNILLKGIDGLYFSDNSLIGLHNGNTPNRIVRYDLDSQGNYVTGKNVISQAGILGEPTQGVFVNGAFHYISNSPWGAYDEDGNFHPKSENLTIGLIK